MDDVTLARPACRALRAHVAACRRDLVAGIVRAIGPSAEDAEKVTALAHGLLDRLAIEAATRDREATDLWAAAVQSAAPDADRGTHVVLACSTLACSLAATADADARAVGAYLGLRGRELARICDLARIEARSAAFDGLPLWVERSELVTSLLASLQARDAATCEHSRAVGTWAERVAAALGMTQAEQETIALAGTLHDIGKLATPTAILSKAGPLDESEWVVMREHSAAGASVLEEVPSLRACAPVVRAHHERVDGFGYPDGLAGERIPLAARIVAVADAFHAMISNRPYRPAMGAAEALATLNAGRESYWDGAVVEVMVGLVRPTFARPAVRIARR